MHAKSETVIKDSQIKLGGENVIVEIDESKFGKRKFNGGHRVDGMLVLGLVERTKERRIVFIPVPNIKAETLLPIIDKFVKKGSFIYTDCWKGYFGLSNNFTHNTVNHSKCFVDPTNGVHANTIQGNWGSFKRNFSIRWRTINKISLPLLIAIEKINSNIISFILDLLQ